MMNHKDVVKLGQSVLGLGSEHAAKQGTTAVNRLPDALMRHPELSTAVVLAVNDAIAHDKDLKDRDVRALLGRVVRCASRQHARYMTCA
jgi:hypothetical protein